MSTPSGPTGFSFSSTWRHLRRALLLRCPNCGSGGLFRRWVVMRETCPRCHLILDRREEDYFLGGYIVNFVTAEFVIAGIAFAVAWATWPDVPWTALKWGLLTFMIPAPFVTYPFSKTVWLAIDLSFRPVTFADLDGHGENVAPDEAAGART